MKVQSHVHTTVPVMANVSKLPVSVRRASRDTRARIALHAQSMKAEYVDFMANVTEASVSVIWDTKVKHATRNHHV